jgi:hypothetical protein
MLRRTLWRLPRRSAANIVVCHAVTAALQLVTGRAPRATVGAKQPAAFAVYAPFPLGRSSGEFRMRGRRQRWSADQRGYTSVSSA